MLSIQSGINRMTVTKEYYQLVIDVINVKFPSRYSFPF